jgi:hypothetical protein
MGTGTDVAMESAGVTLVNGDLNGIVRAVRLSRRTMRNIRQNLVFAFGYNAVGVPLAAVAAKHVHDAGDGIETDILGQNLGRIFRANQTRLQHRKAGRHPHDERPHDEEVKRV